MKDLERYLEKLKKPFRMFWVTEYTNYHYNTHNPPFTYNSINTAFKLNSKSGTYYIQAGPKTFTNRVIIFHQF